METLGGFALHSAPATRPASPSLRSASPNLPAMVRAEPSSAAPHATWATKVMVPSTQSTSYRCSLPGLAGFAGVPSPGTALFFPQPGPNRQCQRFLILMGTLGGFPNPRPPPTHHHAARFARPRALWRRREGRVRRTRGWGGWRGRSRSTDSVGGHSPPPPTRSWEVLNAQAAKPSP